MSEIKSVIDVHHHIIPPQLVAASSQSTSGISIPKWSIEKDLEDMDGLGISGALLSSPNSGTVKLVRMMNTMLAEATEKAPKRYGILASLPFQDTDAALKEIEYACDTLKADGFALQSNYAGNYISDDRFDLILEELNRCSAVVLLHPGTPGGDNLPLFGRHMSVYEFPFETTRAVMDLIYKGKLQRYPKIRWVIAHAGGTIPYLADRLSIAKEWGAISQSPEVVLENLQSLYFELALSASPYVFPALKRLAGASHIVFGTDYPMRSNKGISSSIQQINDTADFNEDETRLILSETSQSLFPRFR